MRLPKEGKREFETMNGVTGNVSTYYGGQLSVSFTYQDIERVFGASFYDKLYDLPIIAASIRDELLAEGLDVEVGDFVRNHAADYVLQFYYGKASTLVQRNIFIDKVNSLNDNKWQPEESIE